ncbi:MAG: glycosyltransferase family 4 protein [Vicinamibacterales bacterium]
MRPPRIAVVSTYYHPVLGGCETHARQVAQALSNRGFDVWVLTRRTPPEAPSHERDGAVAIQRVGPAGRRTGAGKWLALPGIAVALWQRRNWLDLIYCVDVRGLAVACWLVARLTGRPLVLQAETPGALSATNWERAIPLPGARHLIRWLAVPIRRLYGSADAYTCISKEFVREGTETGIPAERLHYVPHAVDEQRFRPATAEERADARARLGLPSDGLVVMFVGRLGVEKGVLDLIEAWSLVPDTTARLVIVGPDMPGHPLDAGPQARARAASLVHGRRVVFAGAIDDPSWALRAADVFVQPSRYEAFGISTIEAMATGLAVVASGVGGMRDYLEDDVNASITGPHDAARLAKGLQLVLRDRERRARLAAAARATVERSFTERGLAERYESLFRKLLADAPGGHEGVEVMHN